MTPWLSQQEIDDMCDPLVQPGAQVRFLAGLGLKVTRKPNGRAIVMRDDLACLQSIGSRLSTPAADSPDKAALEKLLSSRRKSPAKQKHTSSVTN